MLTSGKDTMSPSRRSDRACNGIRQAAPDLRVSSPMSGLLGQRIGRYRIDAFLRAGGMDRKSAG